MMDIRREGKGAKAWKAGGGCLFFKHPHATSHACNGWYSTFPASRTRPTDAAPIYTFISPPAV